MSSLKQRLGGYASGARQPPGWEQHREDVREALALLEEARARVQHDFAWRVGGPETDADFCGPDCLRCRLDRAMEVIR